MSVRVWGIMCGTSLKGVRVGASDSEPESSMTCGGEVLPDLVEGGERGVGRGGVAGARKSRGRSPSVSCNLPLPPPQPADVRPGRGLTGEVSTLGVLGGGELGDVGGVSGVSSSAAASIAKRLL